MWYVCDVVYVVVYVRVSWFVVRGRAVSRGLWYVCCNDCNVVSNGCNEPTSCRVQPIGTHGGEVMSGFALGVNLVS